MTVKVAYELVSTKDGSQHVIEVCGEAFDQGDKGTSKAMSAAYKYAMIQAFCIPVDGSPDADRNTSRSLPPAHAQEPVQGWAQWIVDIAEMAAGCETIEALERIQTTNRSLLLALSRERHDLYAELGQKLGARRKELAKPAASKRGPVADQRCTSKAMRARMPAADGSKLNQAA